MLVPSSFSNASRINELQNEINERNELLLEIENQIEKHEEEIAQTLEEKKTLQNEIYRLKTTADKLQSEIKLTENKINTAGFTIEKLSIEITEKNIEIENKKHSLGEIIRRIDEEENQTLVEILLANNNLSDFFNNLERMEYIQKDIHFNLEELRALKSDLKNQQLLQKQEKSKLENLHSKLADQKNIADINKQKKDTLLYQTKSREDNYKKLLAEKQQKKELFLQELSELEAQLRFEIDPSSIPAVGSGLLSWPMADPSPKSCWDEGVTAKNCITQFFGNTPFATQNPQVYGGNGHNGIDLRASVGDPVMAALSGIVRGTGNTDAISGCYSYGKWVLIEHQNGLSTLYAHLSLIKATLGQSVATGQTIGYSGETGYATGPHLHFTVYATQGVDIIRLGDIKTLTNCANARIPIADKRAYLNPLSYL